MSQTREFLSVSYQGIGHQQRASLREEILRFHSLLSVKKQAAIIKYEAVMFLSMPSLVCIFKGWQDFAVYHDSTCTRCWGNNESGTPYSSVLKKQLVLIGMEIEMECRICIHSGKNLLTQPFPTVSSHFHRFPTKADCDFIEVKPNIPIKSSTYVHILCRRTIFVKYTLQNGTDCLIPRQSQRTQLGEQKQQPKTYFNAILRNRSSKFEWKRRERIYRDGARTRWTIEQTTKHKCMRRLCVTDNIPGSFRNSKQRLMCWQASSLRPWILTV